MRRGLRAMVPALLLAAMPAGAAAQARPDFTGRWTLADSVERPSVAARGDAGFRRGEPGSGWGATLTIGQDAARLTVEYAHFIAYDLQPPIRLAFALDGRESVNQVMIGHAASSQASRAAWEGDALVITTRYPAPDVGAGRASSAEVRRVLRLGGRDSLMIETARLGAGGGALVTSRSVYVKR